mmetsp:Transcript_18155/g.38348  ORF Transcript_18155/g.38348 Transcript_18155/m.38348 type:complete len:143 (+) Transcript_18155:67-495(+)
MAQTSRMHADLAEMMSCDQNDPWGLSKSDCIWMVLKAGKELQVTHVSNAWQDLFGYSREEIMGRSYNFLQGPGTDHPAFKKMLSGANKGKDCGAPFVVYKKRRKLRSFVCTGTNHCCGRFRAFGFEIINIGNHHHQENAKPR